MTFKDGLKWNVRMSAVYALGIWTMIGSYAYLRYTGRYQDAPVTKETVDEPENPNQVVYKTTHTTTVIVYKKGRAPHGSTTPARPSAEVEGQETATNEPADLTFFE